MRGTEDQNLFLFDKLVLQGLLLPAIDVALQVFVHTAFNPVTNCVGKGFSRISVVQSYGT